MKDVTLNQREQARLQVLNNVLEHQLPITQAAAILGVTERHAWRILAAYCNEGAPPWPMGTGATVPPTPFLMPPWLPS